MRGGGLICRSKFLDEVAGDLRGELGRLDVIPIGSKALRITLSAMSISPIAAASRRAASVAIGVRLLVEPFGRPDPGL